MTKLTDVLQKLLQTNKKVSLHVPNRGYVVGRVAAFEDDMVTLQPDEGSKVIIHYTQFSMERD